MIEATKKSNSRWKAGPRRLLTRHRVDIRVRIALSTPVPVILHARAADVSTGGMSVVLPQESASCAVTMVGLKAPGRNDDVWLRVRLRYRSGFRCGFQFVEPTEEQRFLLRQICSSLPA
ncbi:MAG TPA: PilZ domain-containing protein [Terriglobales bacterium]|nr:PilZ domain-containing protein [Terriglobales bacterium]